MKKLFTNVKSILTTTVMILAFAGISKSQVIVVATAATPGPTPYLTLNDAFIAINNGVHQGTIGVAIMTSTVETGSCVLNASGAGSALYTSVTIAPGTDGVSVTGPTVAGRGLIELNGADNVIIDGDNPNTAGTNRNLTLTNTAANTVAYASVVRVALSTLVTSGDNNVVRNCIINGNATGRNTAATNSTVGSENTTYGILVGGGASTVSTTTAPGAITSVTTAIGAGITAANFTATNNVIDACARGIAVQGSATSVVNLLTITNNTIGSATAGNTTTVYSRGITAQGFSAALISGNTVRNIEFHVTIANIGISIGDVSASGNAAVIEKNTIIGVVNNATGTFGAYGINIAGGTNHSILNNFVAGMNHNMTGGAAFSTTFGVHGIRIAGGTGHNVLYNSVHLFGTRLGTPNTSLLSSAFTIVGTTQTGCTVQNNVFANYLTGGTTTIASVSMYLPNGGTSAMNLTLNNNAYYCGTTAASMGICQRSTTYSAANLYLPTDFIQAATAPATNLRSYTSTLSAAGTNDNASWAFTATPPFVSNTDLHINIAAPNVTDLDSRAVVNAVTTDIDGDTRTATPDIGADEFALPICSAANGGTITPASLSVCSGATASMTSTGATTGTGITYQWKVATVSGGPYSNVVGGSGATTTSYISAPLTPGTYYYVLQTTCSAGPMTGLSNELVVTVNALPTVNVSPTSATYCSGGPAVPITAGGASTYSWGPAAGLSATTGSSVTASPSASTTYTVTGTDGNGCTATATTSIGFALSAVVSAVSTPTIICEGGSATLTASAFLAPTYCQPVYSTGTGAGDYISSVTLNTLTNSTGASPSPYYTLYPASGNTTTTLIAGNTYTITLVAGTWNINDLAAWIDFNQNGVLNDPGEKLGETDNLGAAPASTSFVFTVPAGALNGPTRLRVRDMDHATTNDMDPCATQSAWGETEDYVVTITNGVDASTFAWSPATYLGSTTGSTVNASAVLSTTTYTVTATAPSGCTSTSPVTLTVNAAPAITATASANPTCVGASETLSGGGGVSYTWTGGVTDNVAFSAPSPAGSYTYAVTGTDANGCTNTATITVVVNALPIVSVSGPSAICAGDTATLTGSSGGSSQWYMNGSPIPGATTPTYMATAAGVYNMTKTNLNGCTDSSATGLTLMVNALPTVTASATPLTVCAGDSVTAVGAGATSYVWSGGITDNVPFAAMMSMTYTVTGTDANGCDGVDSVAVTVNALPVVSATSTDTIVCENDSVTFMGMGATSYTWNNGVIDGVPYMVTASGTFIVTGTDANGCVGEDTLYIVGNSRPVVTASVTDTLVCAGDSVTFMGAGASTYSWDNGVTDNMPYAAMMSATYNVVGTDSNGCTGSAAVTVNVNAVPNVTLSLPLDTACSLLGSVTLGGESPAGGTWSGPGVTGNSFDPVVAGNGMHAITYTYTDTITGCSATAVDSMLVDICNGIDVNENGNAVIYPNPNNGEFTLIPVGTGLVDVMIYNATGQLVSAEKATAGQPNKLNIAASGMYSVVIVGTDGQRSAQRVIVNR
jgi:hypothetical protein